MPCSQRFVLVRAFLEVFFMSHHDLPSETFSATHPADAENTHSILTDEPDDTALSRRELLQRGTALGAAGLAATGAARGALAQDKPDKTGAKPNAEAAKMPYATLGRTGVKVSRLAMGGSWGVDGEVVAVGIEQGINYIDTAEGYNGGQQRAAFGEFLQGAGRDRAQQSAAETLARHQNARPPQSGKRAAAQPGAPAAGLCGLLLHAPDSGYQVCRPIPTSKPLPNA